MQQQLDGYILGVETDHEKANLAELLLSFAPFFKMYAQYVPSCDMSIRILSDATADLNSKKYQALNKFLEVHHTTILVQW